jgi:hypothetical protein
VPDPYFERPRLAPLRAAASQAGFTEALRRLLSADGYPLAEGEPLAVPARGVARSLTGRASRCTSAQTPLGS